MFKTKPYQHQLDFLNYAFSHAKMLLADEMGSGKTKMAIDLAVILKDELKYEHCLIICGVNSLKWNWQEEIKIHSYEDSYILGSSGKYTNPAKAKDLDNIDNLPYFIITNIESLRYKVKTGEKVKKRVGRRMQYTDDVTYPITDRLVELCDSKKIGMIVVDEQHRIKNVESEQGKQFLRLQAETQLSMTGTPIMNTPLDLFLPLKWLGYEDHSFWQFKQHYCRFGGFGGREVIGYKNLNQLQTVLDKMMMRRTKEELLDLPEKIYHKEYVEMSPKQKKIYAEVLDDIRNKIDLIKSSPSPLSQLTRLRQATGYTGILSSTVCESAKLDRLESLTEDIISNGEKVVVFSNWTSITDEAEKRLKKYNPLVVTGETKDTDRQRLINNFQTKSDCKVFIGTIGALGTGVTLTSANHVIFLDVPWTMASFEQACDRCHRIGQKNVVNIYEIMCLNTIDVKIHELINQKGEMSKSIIDKVEFLID